MLPKNLVQNSAYKSNAGSSKFSHTLRVGRTSNVCANLLLFIGHLMETEILQIPSFFFNQQAFLKKIMKG